MWNDTYPAECVGRVVMCGYVWYIWTTQLLVVFMYLSHAEYADSVDLSINQQHSALSVCLFVYLIHSQLHKIHRVPDKRQSYRIQL